jgi:hypothetical protein
MIINAILKINPNAQVTIRDNDINTIVWHNCLPIPKEQIEALFPIVEFEMALDELRVKRNKLLADTDFHALSDQTLSPEMSAYRQALRDITNGITTKEQIDAIIWPTKPGA